MNARVILATSASVAIAAFTFLTLSARGVEADEKNPTEIGLVDWNRDLDAALAESQARGKPVLVLFQEVPGCAGCQKFGREVLSEPLLVEAIEDLFVPVVVFNNRSSGPDKKILQRFNEPAWNYQVVRFLDSSGRDIIARKEGVWSVHGIASRMIEALEKSQQNVPNYLRTVVATHDRSGQAQVAFAMHCFWTGEYRLGAIDGVIATEAGWIDGREVTLVRYDRNRLGIETLAKRAAKARCADVVYTPEGRGLAGLTGGTLDASYRPASESDQKRQINSWTAIRQLPGVNAMQLTKINSLAPKDRVAALSWLSPRQRERLAKK
ncbi:MAG: VPGUxxT family thioredoxin-like (seleno)protein, type 2 [Planctomycetota bacterium]